MTTSKAAPQLVPYQFPKGKSGNPGGRYNLPADILEARKYNAIEVERVVHKFFEGTVQELEDVVYDPNAPALHALLASMMFISIKKGDQNRLEWLLNRAGIKGESNSSGNELLMQLLMSMKKDELMKLGGEAMKKLSEKGLLDD